MEEEAKIRAQLSLAGELFSKGEWSQCRKVLAEVKAAHASIEMNLLLCEYKEAPQKAPVVLRKLMDILTALNIKLYEERPKQEGGRERAPRISHELYYWNMAVLAGVCGMGEAGELLVSEALHFTDSLRLETSLMLIYQMLKVMVAAGRLASCIALMEKQNRLLDRVRSTSKEEQTYRFINQLLFNKVLLKLGMIQGSRIMFAMRFASKDHELTEVGGLPLAVHQQLLSAEIEYTAANYPLAAKTLADLLPQLEGTKQRELMRSMLDHNLAIILSSYRKLAPAHLLFRKALAHFTNSKELSSHNERHDYIAKCRENMVVSGLMGEDSPTSPLFEAVKGCAGSNSFKFNYRKAEACLKHYHELLATPNRVMPYKEIHDFYEPVYFHPNQPYFQQKGRNKNPNYTNGKCFYRRYVLQCETNRNEDAKAEAHKIKLNEALSLAEWFLQQSLAFLEKERSIVVNLEGEEKGLTEQVNQRLYGEYIDFKASIYCLLCYVHLCKREWSTAIRYASNYLHFEKQYQLQAKSAVHQQIYHSVLTYQMEAHSQLSHSPQAYDLMQQLVLSLDYAHSPLLRARTTNTQQHATIETMSQYHNFCYNITVLHIRENKIAEAYQAIQKMLQVMRVSPSSPQANLPLSMLELLTHYNLRTSNHASALQLLKRRRILNAPAVVPHYQPTLAVTK